MNTTRLIALRRKIRLLTGVMFVAWTLASFAWVWFARDLDMKIGDWPVNFWMATQGSLLIFGLLTVLNATFINRWEADQRALEDEEPPTTG